MSRRTAPRPVPGPSAEARLRRCIAARLDARGAADRDFFAAHAGRIARVCHRMAERFARGGRLIACGRAPAARSDARHVAVEFVHPVIVGKRALPAIGLGPEAGPLARQMDMTARPEDIVIAFDAADEDTAAALSAARARGALTIGFEGADADWAFEPEAADPFVRQELIETLYHILWELVHVFFEHRGLLEGSVARPKHDAGASGFLYPFLAGEEHDLEGVLEDVRRSALMKAEDVAELRRRTVEPAAEVLIAAAAELRRAFDAGGRLLALGNGGSATDAMDAVADFRAAPQGWPARAALDLTEDAAILTAIANDIGTEAMFARQIIAHGEPGDVALALSTSGNSRNVIAALARARDRGLATIALVGYDGGEVAAERRADYIIVTPSEHIPRIQEAQAAVYHILRELVELAAGER